MSEPALGLLARQEMIAEDSAPKFRLESGTRLGRYHILKVVGAGGMGQVYSARDTRLGRVVALKVLTDGSTNGAGFDRLEREARAISSLNHPNICTLYDIGRDNEIDYLVMEYIEGESLDARLRRGSLAMPELLKIATEIAGALDYAHCHGLVHRDLKPGNIMLTERGAKLVDFGLARLRQQAENPGSDGTLSSNASLTRAGVVLGTPRYMAPEQIAGGKVDGRTDIFAFGAVLFEMAYRQKAFAGDTSTQVIEAISNGVLPSIPRQGRRTPAGLEHFILRCLRTAPEERWQAASEALRELQRIEARRRRRLVEQLSWISVVAVLLTVAWIAFRRILPRSTAPRITILHSFSGGNGDGASPGRAGVISDASGSLYGFTERGGAADKGVVYKLTPPSAPGGSWHETVLYRFSGPDGAAPVGVPVFGNDGSMYGATRDGGLTNNGIVFRLRPSGASQGLWVETVLHQFIPLKGDGAGPLSGPILGPDGCLYGTTSRGGDRIGSGHGTVYRVGPPLRLGGDWSEKVLYRFTGQGGDGAYPWAGVVRKQDGSLYGTAFNKPGVVFKLAPPTLVGKDWKETTLHLFAKEGPDGDSPVFGLTVGPNGELYGTTQWGGIDGKGVVYRMTPPAAAQREWSKTTLYRFGGHLGDGTEPGSGLLIGPRGELYGTTYNGGTWGHGTIFKLAPATRPGGAWKETVLYSFTSANGDGSTPDPQAFAFDKTGALCGTTLGGGAYNLGTVFRLVLPEQSR